MQPKRLINYGEMDLYKLMNKIDTIIWRVIYSYYQKSKIIVKINQEKSQAYKRYEGIKQGGILSSVAHLNKLLQICHDYAQYWKLEFNQKKIKLCKELNNMITFYNIKLFLYHII